MSDNYSEQKYLRGRIALSNQFPDLDIAWEQDAGPHGKGICSGCRGFLPVVYASMLQWCEDCYPHVALMSKDTQPKDWKERRKGQVHDYEWVA